MVIGSLNRFLLGFSLACVLLFSLNFVVADGPECYAEEPQFGGDKASCNLAGCLWASDNEAEELSGATDIYDEYCDNSYCCFPASCWQYDGNMSVCTNVSLNGGLNCTWDPFMNIFAPDGSLEFVGGCMDEWVIGGGVSFDDGCWQNDGDKAACTTGANAAKCSWSDNGANENPWCGVQSLTDAQNKNTFATASDIGCCEQKGCWSYDGNQTNCEAAFSGNCVYDTYGGWCNTKWCGEITDETNCSYVKENLYMPCEWSNPGGAGTCEDSFGDGGFGFYNDTDTCFDAGGWYNSTGDCVMPNDGGTGMGGGGFLFGGEATCWFADNQPNVCGNLTGCAYCVDGGGVNGVSNNSATNICSGKQVNLCEGHDNSGVLYSNANNSASLICTDINIKSACNYGPLPNCKWTNSTTSVGAYCTAGTSSEKKAEPPVPFCEHPDSKNNYTMCSQLATDYMMPCIWDNTSSVVKNCTFNGNAVFGEGEKDFEIINSESSCNAAGGSWNTEFYVDDSILKQDSWCEVTGFFDIDNGGGEGNKGNCDTSCWSCEFQTDGSAWDNATVAEAACNSSSLGYCTWTTNSDSFNGFGWCDYPQEMEDVGGKDCNTECGGCDFMANPEADCFASVANAGVGCKWVNDTNNADKGGFCVDKGKKTCDSDCFSCFDNTACYASSLSCTWNDGLCQPEGFDGEICFDGIDNDNDMMVDCGDPDCGFDNFCGGASIGGDCFAQDTPGDCNQTEAFDGMNCSWINDTWNPEGWCDMPGANCWMFDNDMAACGAVAGCTNDSSSFGGPSNMCDLNKTKVESANCWQYEGNEGGCTSDEECQWSSDPFCTENPDAPGCSADAGWCDYVAFASCMGLNESSCGDESSCSWKQDEYSMQGGWCDISCFDWELNETQCGAISGGLCEWRDMSNTCQPEMFMIMGEGGDGASGCWQFDGNETGCNINDVICQYKNDTYANNNKSASEFSGWCMNKGEFEHFGDMKGDVIDLADDPDNAGGAEAGVGAVVDIMGMGMRITPEGFNFGAGMFNMSDSIICNSKFVRSANDEPGQGAMGSGNESGSFYWYLDTNGNEADGCVAYGGSNDSGYDFMINYIARNTTEGIVETKQLMRCDDDGAWSPTNALVTTSKQMSCGEIGGVMIAVGSSDLEAFSSFDVTANMRIFMSSANSADSRESPSDYVGPGYYTPGTIDFAFVDCSDPDSIDPKCKNVLKFGFNVFEECMNGIDDDENGLIDCLDPMCLFTPKCASGDAFSFDVDATDKVAPTVTYSEVEELSDVAFVRIDTNEPSSLNLTFYGNDSTCATENITIQDVGSGYQANAEYKPFHDIDLIDQNLENGTAYYYKTTTCDPSGNCAISACANFTTKTSQLDKEFIFKIDLPENFTVDIPALNKTDYNFTENFGGTEYEVGIKTNTSVTRDMNMTFHCGDMAIGFFGMNVLNPTKIDLTNGFVCDEDENLMGMNSSLKKWNKLIDELHLGGASDYVELTIPIAYSDDNALSWSDDDGTDGEDVTGYVNCSDGGASNTVCKIPVSMGFSAYTVTTPAAAVVDGGSGGGSGGGGGAGVTPVVNNSTNTTTDTSDTTEDDTASGDATADSNGENTVISKGLDNVTNFVKQIGLKSVILVLISLAVIGGSVWYFLADRRKKFVDIRVKGKKK
jgi:hypothetical protein